MVSFSSLVGKRHSFLKEFASGYITALDIGCGTGSDSVALARLGLRVTGIDPSPKMVEQAVKHATAEELSIDFRPVTLSDFYGTNPGSFDLIISLGNTFANIAFSELKEIFTIVYESLNENGTFLFQMLNYNRIMHKNEFYIGKFENDDFLIERKYVKSNDLIFNVTVRDKINSVRKEYNTVIYPHIYPVIMSLCIETGFNRISAYGNDRLETFNENESKDLIIKVIK